MLLAQGCKTLLLGDRVDVCAEDERHKVEERHPGVFGQELLREGQADGRGDPADLHDLPEAHPDGCSHLVVCPSTSDEGHSSEIHGILNRRNLLAVLA